MKNTYDPDERAHDPPIDWSGYNKGRKLEGKCHIKWMARIADMIHDIMGIRMANAAGKSHPYVRQSLNLKRNGPDVCGQVMHFDKHSDDFKGAS